MADDQQPKQTTPQGAEIPVPKREDVLSAFKKVAPPVQPPAAAKHPDAPDSDRT